MNSIKDLQKAFAELYEANLPPGQQQRYRRDKEAAARGERVCCCSRCCDCQGEKK